MSNHSFVNRDFRDDGGICISEFRGMCKSLRVGVEERMVVAFVHIDCVLDDSAGGDSGEKRDDCMGYSGGGT